jgi:uncharacterized protein (DUF433 family)
METPVRRDSSGVLRVGRSRVTLDTVVNAYEAGASAEEIALSYDALSIAQVYATVAYYLQHTDELKPYFEARHQAASSVIAELVNRQARLRVRERLMARKSGQSHG